MLRKIERKSYDFILPELYAKCKQEVKAKAESKNGVTKERVTQQEPIYKNLKYLPFYFFSFSSFLGFRCLRIYLSHKPLRTEASELPMTNNTFFTKLV